MSNKQDAPNTCAACGERKATPLRIDSLGGYVCLSCALASARADALEEAAKVLDARASAAISVRMERIIRNDAAAIRALDERSRVLGAVDAALRQAFVLGLVLDASKTYRTYIDERGVTIVADDEPVIEQ